MLTNSQYKFAVYQGANVYHQTSTRTLTVFKDAQILLLKWIFVCVYAHIINSQVDKLRLFFLVGGWMDSRLTRAGLTHTHTSAGGLETLV